MTVRRAIAEDLRPIIDVTVAVAPEGSVAAEPPVDVDVVAHSIGPTIAAEDGSAVWVLEADGDVVGYALVRAGVPGVLSLAMAIVATERGRGGGRALVDAALEHARDVGAHKLTLEVWPDNGRAIALYVAAGFVVEGLRDRHYRRRDGSLRSALIMARRLDE